MPTPLAALDASSDALSPPWPRLVICCGRRAIGPALAVKRLSHGRTLAAYVQNPELARRKFDLVAALEHDGVNGPNVVTVATALHRVTPARLFEAGASWLGTAGASGQRRCSASCSAATTAATG